VPVASAHKAPDTVLAEIRGKLAETEGKAEGLVRVSRAQSEEIEELRARLRRTAEARADLDEEVRRLRHALIEADESVVNLTRKTTEEMTALAHRLTAGLRADEVPASPALAEELRRRESDLAERESALSERDDRIAALEASRQETMWRADAADDELGRVRAELASLRDERDRALVAAGRADELLASLKAQEATIEEFRRAAAAHVDEVNRLRDAANEQASLVTELEDELRATERYLGAANAEVVQLRAALAGVEEADRGRRSRLAELEGLMLRAEHTAAAENESRQRELAELAVLRARGASGPGEADRLRELEAALAAAQAARTADKARLAELEKQLGETRKRDLRLAELRIEAPDPEEVYERLFDLESQYQAATMAAARVPDLEAKLADLEARLAGSGPH
jgi:chromosome segregation ATPase